MLRAAIHDGTLSCKGTDPCFQPISESLKDAPDRVEWRIVDYCAAVTRIYAIYEQFSHEMIREYLSLLQAALKFNELPNTVQTAYRLGMAKILEKKDGPRYGDLDLVELITQYNLALSGNAYKLEPRVLLMQEQNLRLPELGRLMSNCGVQGIEAWIEKYRGIKEFFAEGDRLTATAAHELAELIEYRNEAAHGGIQVDDLAGTDVLLEFCDFIAALCEALAERVQLVSVDSLIQSGQAQEVGKVDSCIRSGTVLIGPMTGKLRIGASVFLCGDDYCYRREITSIQLDGVDIQEITLERETELGIGIDRSGRKTRRLVVFDPKSEDSKSKDLADSAAPDAAIAMSA